jgi:hypothetical protein
MAFDPMDFKLVDRAHKAVRKHVFSGTPLHDAWRDVVTAATPAVGPKVAKVALKLPITEGLTTCTAEFASLLARDNTKAAKRVIGLYFGLAELVQVNQETVWTPYICGSNRFDPKDDDWPVDPAWFPDDRWAPNEPMIMLSGLRRAHEQRKWYIEVCLIEPLHRLYVAQFARACPRSILLGNAKARGIGCGFDAGEIFNIGRVDAKGFAAMKAP